MLLFFSTEHVRFQQFIKIKIETKQMRKNTQTMGTGEQQQSTLIAYSCILDCTCRTCYMVAGLTIKYASIDWERQTWDCFNKTSVRSINSKMQLLIIVSFKSIGISSCGGIKQSWRNRVNCSHICNVCCARGDGFKSRCYIYVSGRWQAPAAHLSPVSTIC